MDNTKIGFETLQSIAQKLCIGKDLLKSLIEINEATRVAVAPYRGMKDKSKVKKVLPPNVVKIIYDTLGYPS